MELLQAILSAGKVRESRFNHRLGPVKLEQGCLRCRQGPTK